MPAEFEDVDSICEEFDSAQKSGDSPPLEKYLERVAESDRAILLPKLVWLEIEFRQSLNKAVAIKDYERYGDVATRIAQHFVSINGRLRDRDDAAPSAPVPKQLEMIDRFQLIEKIGEGGMGIVWRAIQQKPVRRDVALKLIRGDISTESSKARFDIERQSLAIMDHPNIARVIDGGTTSSGAPYYVMELVDGKPLTAFCDSQKLSVRQRLELVVQVCDAVQYAHQKGIIHRDIKPSNVLAFENDKDGMFSAKVIDFGLAKIVDDANEETDRTWFTGCGRLIGTMQYMAPEQAAEANSVDTRSDIYSLGVMLYELLTGTTPISRKMVKELGILQLLEAISKTTTVLPSVKLQESPDTVNKLCELRSSTPSSLPKQLAGELDWILMKALEHEPARRYESAGDLAADLQRHLNGETVEAGPASQAYLFKKWIQKNFGLFLALAGITTALVLGVIGTSIGMYRASQSAQAAEASKNKAEAASVRAEASRVKAEASRVKAEGSKAVAEAAQTAAEASKAEAEAAQTAAEASEVKAVASASRSANVLSIVTKSFRNIDPRLGIPLKMTATEVLENALQSIEESELDDEGKALLLRALTKAFVASGDYETAQATAEQEIETRKQIPEQDRERLEAINTLSFVLRLVGKPKESVAIGEPALEEQIEKFSLDDEGVLAAKANLSFVFLQLGELDKAEQWMKETYVIQSAKFGELHRQTLSTKMSIAQLQYERGNHGESCKLMDEVVAGLKKVIGEEHLDTLTAMTVSAERETKNGNSKKALAIAESVVKSLIDKVGAKHPKTAAGKEVLSSIYQSLGQPDKAISNLEDAVKILKTPGPMGKLAVLYFQAGKRDEAISMFEKVFEVQMGSVGPTHPDTLGARMNLAMAYLRAGRTEEALKSLKETRSLQKDKLGEKHPVILQTTMQISNAYTGLEEHQTALDELVAAMEDQTGVLNDAHPLIVAAKYQLAICLRNVGRLDESCKLFDDVIKERTKARSADHPATLAAINGQALTLVQQKKFPEAIEKFKIARKGMEKTYNSDHAATLTVVSCLAEAYLDSGDYKNSLELYEELLPRRKKVLGPTHPDVIDSLEGLIRTLKALGKDERAEALQEEVDKLLEQAEQEKAERAKAADEKAEEEQAKKESASAK